MKRQATISVSYNPNTGIVKPWEVYFQCEDGMRRVVASCKTEEGANKSAKECAKRNSSVYQVLIK